MAYDAYTYHCHINAATIEVLITKPSSFVSLSRTPPPPSLRVMYVALVEEDYLGVTG
jgi:hypothetical protein